MGGKRVLSFGGGVQTTALAIMAARGEVEVDEVVFADTGAEKPEPYWYMQNYTLPMFEEAGIPFVTVKSHLGTLEEYCLKKKLIPSTVMRWCSDKFKITPIRKRYKDEDTLLLIGFSAEETRRKERAKEEREYPLIDRGMKASDCLNVISNYGWPMPCKSSCFFCVFQPPPEWNWFKLRHPRLIHRAMEIESNYHQRRPETKGRVGLLWGKPLWKFMEGTQSEFVWPGEYSCWSGYCGH